MSVKEEFEAQLKDFVTELEGRISTEGGEWTIKGFSSIKLIKIAPIKNYELQNGWGIYKNKVTTQDPLHLFKY